MNLWKWFAYRSFAILLKFYWKFYLPSQFTGKLILHCVNSNHNHCFSCTWFICIFCFCRACRSTCIPSVLLLCLFSKLTGWSFSSINLWISYSTFFFLFPFSLLLHGEIRFYLFQLLLWIMRSFQFQEWHTKLFSNEWW